MGEYQHAPEPGQKLTNEEGVAPCTAAVGRLRLKRTGTILHYLWASGTAGDGFTEFHHCDFGAEDVERITLVGATGRKPRSLDVRWLDFQVRCEAAPTQAAAVPTPPAPETVWTPWFLAGLAVPLCLAVWLAMHHRWRAEKTATSIQVPAPGGEREPVKAVSFACLACGKKLKARAELAGKKVRCSGCGVAALVPVGQA